MNQMQETYKAKTKVSKSKVVLIFLGVLVLAAIVCLGKLVEDVKNETIVVNQVPITGTMEYWTTPGLQWQRFGKITTYYKTQQLWFGSSNDDGEQMGNPIPVIFNDASDGQIYGSLRIKLPTDPKFLARIQTDYNGMDRLMNDLVRQTVNKVIYASGPLMSAFESYAEKKNDLIDHITDQLNNGIYRTTVHRVETVDPISGETKIVNMASLIPDSLSPGGWRRSEVSPFSYYGLEVGQVAVSKIDYSDKVTQQIAQQQEANMLIQTSKAKAAAAQQETIRAQAEGEANAARARWQQEEIKAVEVTKAEQEYEVARLNAQKAEEYAKQIKAEGDAKAHANRALVAAGLTPLERATIDKETKIGVAEAVAKIKLPTAVMGAGSGNGSNPMDIVGVKMLMDLVDRIAE